MSVVVYSKSEQLVVCGVFDPESGLFHGCFCVWL